MTDLAVLRQVSIICKLIIICVTGRPESGNYWPKIYASSCLISTHNKKSIVLRCVIVSYPLKIKRLINNLLFDFILISFASTLLVKYATRIRTPRICNKILPEELYNKQ